MLSFLRSVRSAGMNATRGPKKLWGVQKMKTVVSGRQRRPALLLSAAIGLGLSVMGVGSTAQAMSLKDAIQLVLTTNPDVGVVAKDRRAIDQELRQAWGLYFPQIDVKLDGGPEYTESGSVDHPPTYLDQGPHDGGRWLVRSDAQLTLQQRLFDGFEAA